MRKLLITRFKPLLLTLAAALLALGLFFPAESLANSGFGFSPQMYKSGYTYGNGIYFAPYDFVVYESPSEESRILRQFHWDRETRSNSIRAEGSGATRMAADHVFFCFYPEMDIAMMAVVGDTEDGWLEVVYDQAKRKTGWIKPKKPEESTNSLDSLEPIEPQPAHLGVYQTWQDFMKLNARANGVYWLSGVSQYHRSVRQSDQDEAKFIPITIIRDLKVRHLRGNWLLVEVLDFERNTPIGWVRWRDSKGQLLLFPNITGGKMPIVTTAY